MPSRSQIVKGAFGHLGLFFVNFCVLLGVVLSFRILTEPLPTLNLLALGFMLVHTFMLLSLQLGIQILELIRIRMPTVLISYYFLFGDDESIPVRLLDPTKSKLAVVILILIVTGGPVLYPIFAVYGFIQAYAYLSSHLVEPIQILDPGVIADLFERLLNQLMAPVLLVIVGLVIVSIVVVEFRHI